MPGLFYTPKKDPAGWRNPAAGITRLTAAVEADVTAEQTAHAAAYRNRSGARKRELAPYQSLSG
jgi:hypothetical protein